MNESVMKNYEAKKPSYFATPSPQLIHALHASLRQILASPLEDRWAAHRRASERVKKVIHELGLKQLAQHPEEQANGMTAFWLPQSITPGDVLPKLLERGGVVLAGGLHKEIAGRYLRVGHMGISVVSIDPFSMILIDSQNGFSCYPSLFSRQSSWNGWSKCGISLVDGTSGKNLG